MRGSCLALGRHSVAWRSSRRSTLLSAVLSRDHNTSNSKMAIIPPDATGLVSFINASPTRNVERSEKNDVLLTTCSLSCRGRDKAKTRRSWFRRNQSSDTTVLEIIQSSAHYQQERDSWNAICKPGGKYYLTRNGSSIVAFAIGKKWVVS